MPTTLLVDPAETSTLLSAFPDSARAWLFASPRALSHPEQQSILDALHKVVGQWKSHGTIIPAQACFLEEAILMVVADFSGTEMSGCSIDRMISTVRDVSSSGGINLMEDGIAYWNADGYRHVPRAVFAALAEQGVVLSETAVADLTLTTLGEVRSGKWKHAAKDGWHRRAFALR